MATQTTTGKASTNPANNLAAPITTGNTYGGSAALPVQYSYDYKTGKSTPTGYTYSAPSANPTVLSSSNPADSIPKINDTLNKNKDMGAKTVTGNDGSSVYTDANGKVLPPPGAKPMYDTTTGELTAEGKAAGLTPMSGGKPIVTPTITTTPSTTQTGGYNGNTWVPPGSTIPTDSSGNPITLNAMSTEQQGNIDNMNKMRATANANSASLIANIQKQYEDFITQQKASNAGQEAGTTNALFHSGAMEHDVYSNDRITAQVTYDTQQVSNLIDKEAMAVSQAQTAADNNDWKMVSDINDQIAKYKQYQTDTIKKINDNLLSAQDDLQKKKLQATKDNAISDIYSKGTTDPTQILSKLKDAGYTDITASDIKGVLDVVDKNLADYKKQQQDVVNAAQTAGDMATAGKVLALDPKSPTFMQDLAKLQTNMKTKAPAGIKATQAEKQSNAVANMQTIISSGQPMKDGTPIVDTSGFVTPKAWKAFIAEAPSEGLTRLEFIKQFGYLLYSPNGTVDPQYGLTPAEQKVLTGALPTTG